MGLLKNAIIQAARFSRDRINLFRDNAEHTRENRKVHLNPTSINQKSITMFIAPAYIVAI